MSIKKLCIVTTLLSPFLITACSSSSQYQLTAAGQRVEFVDTQPADNCQFLGKVEGRRGAFFSGSKTHSELMRDAAIDLLNNAATMGGNTIYNAMDSSTKYVSDFAPLDVVMEGEVYKCP